jgi:hypothetical protein
MVVNWNYSPGITNSKFTGESFFLLFVQESELEQRLNFTCRGGFFWTQGFVSPRFTELDNKCILLDTNETCRLCRYSYEMFVLQGLNEVQYKSEATELELQFMFVHSDSSCLILLRFFSEKYIYMYLNVNTVSADDSSIYQC